jgi:hypothetical protein
MPATLFSQTYKHAFSNVWSHGYILNILILILLLLALQPTVGCSLPRHFAVSVTHHSR